MFSTLGTRIYFGQPVAVGDNGRLVLADLMALDWIELGGATDLGRAGGEVAIETYILPSGANPAELPLQRKDVVSVNNGTMILLADLDHADAGQAQIARSLGEAISVRIVLSDAPIGGWPSERLFVAIVTGCTEQWDDASAIQKMQISLEIDSKIIRVTAGVS